MHGVQLSISWAVVLSIGSERSELKARFGSSGPFCDRFVIYSSHTIGHIANWTGVRGEILRICHIVRHERSDDAGIDPHHEPTVQTGSVDLTSVLAGRHVRLEPLSLAHAQGLADAAGVDRRHYGWTRVPDGRDDAAAYITDALDAAEVGVQIPYAVVTAAEGRVVGSTRYLNIERWSADRSDAPPDVLEIGSTWYADDMQGTLVNPESKLLLMRQAFDEWRVHRVQFRTDRRNERSRSAIAKLGATFEGILRNAHPAMGDLVEPATIRDTAVYSVLPSEWPEVEASLLRRLDAH